MAVPTATRLPSEAPPTGAPVGAPVGAPASSGMGYLGVATPPFFLAFNQQSLDICEVHGEVEGRKLDGWYWLPSATPKLIEPGCHGFRTRRNGEGPDATWILARDVARLKGEIWIDYWTPIAANYCPPGVDGSGGYLHAMKVQRPGSDDVGVKHYEIWDVPQANIPGREVRFVFHTESYNRWLASLVIRGVLPAVPELLIAEHRDAAKRVLSQPITGENRDRAVRNAERASEAVRVAA